MLKGNKKEILKLVGENLRARRLSLNLSQAEAAERSGISHSTLKKLEAGRGASIWAVVSFCRTYGHDRWVHELAPKESLDVQLKAAEGHKRLRASKRKGLSRKKHENQHE